MQTLKEKSAKFADQLQELAQVAKETSNVNEADKSSSDDRTNWNKGWGKYGKT